MTEDRKTKHAASEEAGHHKEAVSDAVAAEFGGEATEARLRDIEARYSALFDRSIYCVYVHDLDGRFLDVNDATLNLLGYTRNEIGALSLASILEPDQLNRALEAIKRILDKGPSGKTDLYWLRCKDGGRVCVETDASIIYRAGKPYAIQGVAKDITPHRQALEALKQSERKYRTLFDESADGIYITSRDGEILDANPAMLKLFGYTGEEFQHLNVRHLYNDPKDREAFQRRIETEGSVKDYDVRFKKKNGDRIECRLTTTIRRSGDGSVIGYQGMIRDVTEHKRAQESLREREAHYRAIVGAFDGLIYICSQDYRVEYTNQNSIDRIGHDPTGDRCFTALHGLDSVCPWCVSDRVFNGETVRWEVLSPKDNRWYYVVNTPIRHEDGSLSNQAMILDITDRKQMEEALKESSEKLKMFAYSVSHDIKSPAISSHGFAKRLHDLYGESLDEKGKDYCRRILSASEQMAALADEINNYMSAKEATLTIEPVNLEEVLRLIKDEFAAPLEERQIRWVEPRHPPSINADRLSLIRMLRNFVDNALKYAGEALSRICIGYEGTDQHHVLSVQDDGVGVTDEDAVTIFDLFTRRSQSRRIQGTGLGLAIVKEIAHRHGGHVWVESDPGKGATFYVSLSKDLPCSQSVGP